MSAQLLRCRVIRFSVLLGVLLSIPLACGLASDSPRVDVALSIRPAEISGYRLAASLPSSECEDRSEDECACCDVSILIDAFGDTAGRGHWVCLGPAGVLVARMGEEFVDGAGADLRVYEYGETRGAVDDSFSVYVSVNGSDWVLVAESVCNGPGRAYAAIEIPSGEDYLYVRIVSSARPDSTSNAPAILAIEALHSARRASF